MEEKIFFNFYNTPRLSLNMSDGGGPFSLDIHNALEVCYLIDFYKCDVILETGTNTGDTTEFLAKTFSHLPIETCEVEKEWCHIAQYRLKKYSNVNVYHDSSQNFISRSIKKYSFPFFFLDAHWLNYWPLKDELSFIDKGVVCVHDFNIENVNYSFDSYQNTICDAKLVKENLKHDVMIFTNNPKGTYSYPLLQRDRLSGRGYFVIGKDTQGFTENDKFKLLESEL
tara:strand:+ start:1169 stop:1846 length:678 start_codon:yes stop_codon:yes gene_type:complete